MIEIDIRKNLLGAGGAFTLDVRLTVQEGEIVALYGESGAGKTTLLRLLAGLAEPDAGHIRFADETWFDGRSRVPAQRRRVGYLFQDYALFPGMSVRGNIEFALQPGTGRQRASDLIDLMGLGELQHRKPHSLSGGQQQRVALARALAAAPRLLLLDEAFSALDHETRLRLQDEVLRMQRRFGITVIIVSHDVSEVYRLARRVLIIEEGRIVREGPPAEVFSGGRAGGKFSFAGEILAIEAGDVAFAVTLLVGNQIVRVIATADEVKDLRAGDRVMLLSKAFNPMLVVC
jgi:molybdate transport system ATP-binding protein